MCLLQWCSDIIWNAIKWSKLSGKRRARSRRHCCCWQLGWLAGRFFETHFNSTLQVDEDPDWRGRIRTRLLTCGRRSPRTWPTHFKQSSRTTYHNLHLSHSSWLKARSSALILNFINESDIDMLIMGLSRQRNSYCMRLLIVITSLLFYWQTNMLCVQSIPLVMEYQLSLISSCWR